MARVREIPKLNVIKFQYNGDQSKFEKFLSDMANDYLNSDTLPEYIPIHFVDNIDFGEDNEKPLDI
ncbi:MAG: hypothetical protein K2J80_00405 [Oscillospiraceae bacterium]|nr:hypothetical protein [Oscillospiraceae bacterium]